MTQVVDLSPDASASADPRTPWLPAAARRIGTEVAKFGTVGAMAFVIDVGLFNLARATVLADSPLTAKGISVLAATTFAYFANRHWTYGDRARTGHRREALLFLVTNAAALLIAWACLFISHYLLGLDSHLADNVSGNIIGVGLGTLFRFWVYRTWVFPEQPMDSATAASVLDGAEEAAGAATPVGPAAAAGPAR
jgi:putative flippase GtrA